MHPVTKEVAMTDLVFHTAHLPRPLEVASVRRIVESLARSTAPRPAVFELRADDAGVHHLVGAAPEWIHQLTQLVSSSVVDARTTKAGARGTLSTVRRVELSGGLPIKTDDVEASAHAVYSALSARKRGEVVALQVALGAAHSPQLVPDKVASPAQQSLWHALTTGPAPASAEVRRRMKTRAAQATIRTTIRIGVTAATPARRQHLTLTLFAALQGLEAPGATLRLIAEQAGTFNAATLSRRPSGQLSVDEVIAFLGWPIGDDDLPGLPSAHPRRIAPPETLSSSDGVFATSNSPGLDRQVGITATTRLQHTVVTGPTGSGKSMVLARLALADIAAGRPLVLVDPKRQLVDYIVDHAPAAAAGRIVILDAADDRPVGFNPLDTKGRPADVVVDGILSSLKAVFHDGWGPRTEDLLHAGLLTLARAGDARDEPYTLIDLPRLLTDAAFRRSVIGAVANDQTLSSFWAGFEEMSVGQRAAVIGPPMNKLRKFVLRRNVAAVLGQSRPAFRLRDVFRNGTHAVLVPLNDALLGPGAAQLLGSLIVAEVWMATLERAAEKEPTKRPGMVFVDEVQQFLNLPTSIADALATSRSYGVGWHLAHQFRDQLSPAMRAAFDANARSKVVFALGPDDARDMARMAPRLVLEDFQSLAPYEIYATLVDRGAPSGWFSAKTLPPEKETGHGDLIRRASRDRYGSAVSNESPTRTPEPPRAEPGSHRRARRA
jgi:hypothetical protein